MEYLLVYDLFLLHQKIVCNCWCHSLNVDAIEYLSVPLFTFGATVYHRCHCLISVPLSTFGCVYIVQDPSTKTGAREVNSMGGDFAKRVYDKSKFKTKDDFLFCHLDGAAFTTKQFRTAFERMIIFTKENERLVYMVYHYWLF